MSWIDGLAQRIVDAGGKFVRFSGKGHPIYRIGLGQIVLPSKANAHGSWGKEKGYTRQVERLIAKYNTHQEVKPKEEPLHVQDIHVPVEAKEEEPPVKKEYKCDKCDWTTNNRYALAGHMKKHSKGRAQRVKEAHVKEKESKKTYHTAARFVSRNVKLKSESGVLYSAEVDAVFRNRSKDLQILLKNVQRLGPAW